MSGSVCDDVDSGVVAGGLGTRAHAITEDLVGFSSEARASGSSAGRRLPVSGGQGAEGTGLDGTGAALRVAAAGSGSAGVTTGGLERVYPSGCLPVQVRQVLLRGAPVQLPFGCQQVEGDVRLPPRMHHRHLLHPR